MSEIRKQGILFSLFSYLGVILGYANIVFSTKVLLQPQLGLVSFIIVAGSLLGILAQSGMPSTIIRFFPTFKDKSNNHGNFLSFTIAAIVVVCPFVIAIGALLQNNIVNIFAKNPENHSLIHSYYWLVYALLPFLAIFNLLCAYSYNFQKTAITAFFQDIFIRTASILLLLPLHFQLISFDTFIKGLVFVYWLQALGMIAYLYYLGEFKLNFNFSAISPQRFTQIIQYSTISMLTGASIYLVNFVDQIMVTLFSTNQLADGATYRVFFYIGIVIAIPYRALVSSSQPVVAQAFQDNDLKKIEHLYQRNSLLMIAIGSFLFAAIYANLNNIVSFFGEEYAEGKMVAVYIGLNALFNIASSINGVIIAQSKIYRYDLYFNLALVLINIALNYLFIKLYGLVGAALATALSGVLYNLFKIGIVKWQFNMQPFRPQSLHILLLLFTTLAFNTILPTLSHWLPDAIYRTALLALLYGGILLYFKLVPDLNHLLQSILTPKTKPPINP